MSVRLVTYPKRLFLVSVVSIGKSREFPVVNRLQEIEGAKRDLGKSAVRFYYLRSPWLWAAGGAI